tara:strand:+ start:858 stop:1067 length:210 start_codon:yes stop_codon:yes gene_type:complete
MDNIEILEMELQSVEELISEMEGKQKELATQQSRMMVLVEAFKDQISFLKDSGTQQVLDLEGENEPDSE